jgi:hypothetical protein
MNLLFTVACLPALSAPGAPLVVNLPAGRDNTLFENTTGALSNGSGQFFFAGRTGQLTDSRRRGLIRFDVGAAIPAGSTIHGASLRLHMSLSVSGPVTTTLHRVTADWGESTSDAAGAEGTGAPSAPGDATWVHAFYPDSPWAAPGGAFEPAASGSTVVDLAVGDYSWAGTPAMIADVQGWLDVPAENFGWVVIADEAVIGGAKRFDSRENPDPLVRPVLVVEYLPPMLPGDANCDGQVDEADIDLFVQALLEPGAFGGCDLSRADVNGDGLLDAGDIPTLLQRIGV